eukprot:scaffold7428_cov248-Pinguiococcus_pyrenoidosus.AAC.2
MLGDPQLPDAMRHDARRKLAQAKDARFRAFERHLGTELQSAALQEWMRQQRRRVGPLLGIFLQAEVHELTQVLAERPPGQRRRRAVVHGLDNAPVASVRDGQREAAQGQGDQAQPKAPDVARVRVLLRHDALGTHVQDGARERLGPLHALVQRLARDAEVANLDLTRAVQQDVARLDVSVELLVPVDAAQASQHRLGDRCEHVLVHRHFRVHEVLQRARVHILQHDAHGALPHVGEDVKELDNARFVALPKRPQGPQFLDHPAALLRRVHRHDLHGHQRHRRHVDGLVHTAGRSAAELAEELDVLPLVPPPLDIL